MSLSLCWRSLYPPHSEFPSEAWADVRYENEAPVGRAVRDFTQSSGVPRSEIFVTSKLMRNRSYDLALSDLRTSLQEAGLDYFDLYLMHSPLGGAAKRRDVWRALLAARDQGLVKSVGVSNFGAKHIAEMVEQGAELPALNQIDLHPFMRHPDIVDACEKHGIALEAWAPLARGLRFDHPVVLKMREKYGRSAAQIFLRWGLQHVRLLHSRRPRSRRRATSSSRNRRTRSASSRTRRSSTLSSARRTWTRCVPVLAALTAARRPRRVSRHGLGCRRRRLSRAVVRL